MKRRDAGQERKDEKREISVLKSQQNSWAFW
jgi:hypothetical protein